jgi:hypothetical protein
LFLQCCVTTQVKVPREALCTDMAEYLSLTCEPVPYSQGIAERLDSRSLRGTHVALSGVCCAGSNRDVCGDEPDARSVGVASFLDISVYRRTRALQNTGARYNTGLTVTGLPRPPSVVERCFAAWTSSSVPLPRSVLCVLKTRGRVLTRAVATPP